MTFNPVQDVIIAGAGLAGSLVAMRLATQHPDLRILIVDRDREPGRGHTWSFHSTDLDPQSAEWIRPAIAWSWQGQEVRFPTHQRQLRAGYNSITPDSLRAALIAHPQIRVVQGTVAEVDGAQVRLEDGRRFTAPLTIDARGHVSSRHMRLGYQKFLGLELEVPGGHGLPRPVIMDATVPQLDGYRFVYCLPFTADRVLVEDTRYSDGPGQDPLALRDAVLDYAVDRGWKSPRILRQEDGVLPIALALDAAGLWQELDGSAVPIGLRAGLFHPVTGYSLPTAVRTAEVIAAAPRLQTEVVFPLVRDFAVACARRQAFLRLLNRMLFRGCPPQERYRLLERFYRLPEPLIERFYADRLTLSDTLRIVTGKPPIPLRRAFACLAERPLLEHG